MPRETTLWIVSLTYALPILASFEYLYGEDWAFGIPGEHFAVLSVLMLGFATVGLRIQERARSLEKTDITAIGTALLAISGLYAVALVWLTTHAVLLDEIAIMASLFLYTVVGIVAYFYGLTQNKHGLKIAGGILLGGVVLRLLLVDVWMMALTARIITFGVIGIILLSTAFISRQQKQSTDTDITNQSTI
jgi:hypothetical protein